MLIRAVPDDDQAAVRRLTEKRLDSVVRSPGYSLPGVCLKVIAE